MLNGRFVTSVAAPTGWTHIVLNYIGPNNGQGIEIYHNGVQIRNDATKSGATRSSGDCKVVIGRLYADTDDWYGSVDVDELLFFNQKLTDQEIQDIRNMI